MTPLSLFVLLTTGGSTAKAQDLGSVAPPVAPAQNFPGLMNPSISANGLFLAGGQWNDGELVPLPDEQTLLPGQGETFGTGLSLQEMEVQLLSAVDPYFKANMVLAIPGGEGLEVEEGFVTLTSVPRLLVNVGKFKQPFGRENLVHTHALLTIDKALISQRVFGEEGLNDVGVNAQLMLPTPWYAELTLGVDAGHNDVVLASGKPSGQGIMAHLKNVVDLSSKTTAEIGLSGLTGQNDIEGRSVVAGADLTFKGRGTGTSQFKRIVWQNEFILLDRKGESSADDETVGGLYSTLEASPTRRLWLGGRFDLVGLPDPVDGGTSYGASAIALFAPSEFSAVRLQGQRQFLPEGHTIDSVTAQLIYAIGAHPAHSY